MLNNKMRGTWDQMTGISRELWGELIGDGHEFSTGQRQRLIGKLESGSGMSPEEAAKLVDQQKH